MSNKKTLVTQDILRVLGALCQEAGTKANIFVLYYTSLSNTYQTPTIFQALCQALRIGRIRRRVSREFTLQLWRQRQ